MRAVVIYESMYGNTRLVAEAIARGLQPGNDVTVASVAKATHELLDGPPWWWSAGGPAMNPAARDGDSPAFRPAAGQDRSAR